MLSFLYLVYFSKKKVTNGSSSGRYFSRGITAYNYCGINKL